MARPFRPQIDASILDRAAALFARHGFDRTPLQAVAAANGLSKAGLLHHFPSKEALRQAALDRAHDLQLEVVAQVADLPVGPERDRAALECLLEQALDHPGLTAFNFSRVAGSTGDALPPPGGGDVDTTVLAAFGVDSDTDPRRLVRVIGALGALSVLVVTLGRPDRPPGWRRHLVDTCVDTLGHASESLARQGDPPRETIQAPKV